MNKTIPFQTTRQAARQEEQTAPVALLGGSFDPVHLGHIKPAIEMANQLAINLSKQSKKANIYNKEYCLRYYV